MDSEVSGSSMLLEHLFLPSFKFVVVAPSVRRQKQKKTERVGFLGILMVHWKAENWGDADTSRHIWPTLTRLCSA